MHDPLESLASLVFMKLEEDNFKGVIRLASAEDTIVEYSENTLSALRGKHPAPHTRYSYSTSSNPFSSSVLTTTDWFRPSNLFQKVQLVDQIVLDLNFFIT